MDQTHPSKYQEGQLLLIDKPYEWTSFDVVNKLRYALKKNLGIKKIKVGHAGTLDPLATGLLIVCTGRKTKEINQIQGLEKEYVGTFTLGATTASHDLEEPIQPVTSPDDLTQDQIDLAIKNYRGDIQQIPPHYSAVKVQGKRAYEVARSGLTPEISAKAVCIHQFEVTRTKNDELSFKIRCSKGTYIRSIARDLGNDLKCGAYLSSLRRTKIGEFTVDEAFNVDDMVNQIQSESNL